MRFVFLLTLLLDNQPPMVYVVDSGLTGEDCIAAMENYAQTTPEMQFGVPSCEIDFDLTGPIKD